MVHRLASTSRFGSTVAVSVPGDKSISHRALFMGALAQGLTCVTHLLDSDDVRSTAACLKALGVEIWQQSGVTFVQGVGAAGFRPHADSSVLPCGNSGTTMRLLMGVLAGKPGAFTLVGDASLQQRPMERVAHPLRMMGADILLSPDHRAPVHIRGRPLHGIHYALPVASAQLKSALLFAGLFAEGQTTLTGLLQSRDHTERMLRTFGVRLEEVTSQDGEQISIRGGQVLQGCKIQVPGDPSSAAFWIAAAVLIPGEGLRLENLSLNSSRLGFVRALMRMGAQIDGIAIADRDSGEQEPVGTLRVSASDLRGIQVSAEEIPFLIDEVPLLAILATQARGVTEIHGLRELRVKECDRLEAIVFNLRAMGAQCEVGPDFLRISGPQLLHGATVKSWGDHRIAMAFSIAALLARGESEILDSECVTVSYPDFYAKLQSFTGLSDRVAGV